MPVGSKSEKRSSSPTVSAVQAMEVVLGIRSEEYVAPPRDEQEKAAREALDERRRKLHDEPPSDEERTATLSGSE